MHLKTVQRNSPSTDSIGSSEGILQGTEGTALFPALYDESVTKPAWPKDEETVVLVYRLLNP